MSIDIPGIAGKYSHFLRLCWLGALLHDVGKLGIHFILSKERNSPVADIHGQIIFADGEKVPGTLFRTLSTPFEEICPVPRGYEYYSLIYFICSHHGCLRCMGTHHCKSRTIDRHRLTMMLQAADRIDTSNPADIHKQSLLEIKGSDFFSEEYELEPHLFTGHRKRIYRHMEKILSEGNSSAPEKIAVIEKVLERFLSRGLSETRKWAHDIDIFSHSRSVAVYLRLMLLNFLCENGEERRENVPFKVLRVFCDSWATREKVIRVIQDELCLGAAIYSTLTEVLFFINASLEREVLAGILQSPFELSDTRETGHTLEPLKDVFYPDMPDVRNVIILNIPECLGFIKTCEVRKPEDIAPGYSMERLVNDMNMVLDYPDYCDLNDLMEKKRSLGIHLGNMEKALKSNCNMKREEVYNDTLTRLACLEEQIQQLPPGEVFLERWGWRSRSDAAKAIWDFLALVLSPIRPPSPITLARRWKKNHAEGMDIQELAQLAILQKQLNLSRFFVLKRSVKEIFRSLGMGKKREAADLALYQEAPVIREVFERGPYHHLSRFFIFT